MKIIEKKIHIFYFKYKNLNLKIKKFLISKSNNYNNLYI